MYRHSTEAYQLITQPVPNFPGDRIFNGEVVNEIIRVTGCHPFLVQAVCSTLVDNLNIDKRNQVELVDVTRVVAQLFDTWKAFFQNLWERTDQNQRICLVALNNLSKGDFKQIMEQSKFGQETEKITLEDIRSALQTLHKRDLVGLENDNYYIATPIFSEWVKLGRDRLLE